MLTSAWSSRTSPPTRRSRSTIITGYAKNGITIDGFGSDGDIHDNTVSGFGPTSVVAQNGIEISRGATGEVYNNSVSDNQYTGLATPRPPEFCCTAAAATHS